MADRPTTPQHDDPNDPRARVRRWRALPLRWAMRTDVVSTQLEALVLIGYAEHSDPDGCGAYPGPETLALIARTDERTVKRVRATLVKRGLLVKGDQSRTDHLPRGRRPVVYDVPVPFSFYLGQKDGSEALADINAVRRAGGLPPLSRELRPDLAPVEKKHRADKGKPRAKADQSVATDHPEEPAPAGVSASHPSREVPPTSEGCLEDTGGGVYETRVGVSASHSTAPCDPTSDCTDEAPYGRVAPLDVRRTTTGSKAAEDASGYAASGKTQRTKLTRGERDAVTAVWELLPAHLREVVHRNARGLDAAILDALATGQPWERTPQQLVTYRLMPRWDHYWAPKLFAGEVDAPVGALRAMLKRDAECGDDRCDDRTNVDFGQPCVSCAQRREDKRAARPNVATVGRAAEQVPTQRRTEEPPAAREGARHSEGCECWSCEHERAQTATAEEPQPPALRVVQGAGKGTASTDRPLPPVVIDGDGYTPPTNETIAAARQALRKGQDAYRHTGGRPIAAG